MLRATLTSMLHRKLRLVLSGLAVVLGVMFVSGSLILTDTLSRSFDNLFAGVYADTDVQVHGEPKVAVDEFEGEQVPATMPADIVDRVADVPGVASAVGEVEADGARVIGSDGKVVTSFGPPRLGVNWGGQGGLIELRDGRGPSAPNEIAIDAALASNAGLSVGDQVGVLTLEPRQDFELVGTFGFTEDRDTIGGVQFVAFTDEVAQELMLGETGVWTAVDVKAAPGVSHEQLRDDLTAALGDGYQVRTGAELAEDASAGLRSGLAFFNNILLGFAGVALFVGIFLILNTFSIMVAQRTRELALTRAVGASRRQIVGSVLVEAVVIGLIAAGLGLAAGVGVGALLATLAGGFASLPTAGLAVPASAVISAFTVGVLVTVVAAGMPALRASRVPPVAAMQEAATPDRPLTRLSVAGTATLAAGGAMLALGLTGNAGGQELWAVLGGVLVCFVGAALLTPLIARPVVSLLGRLFSWSVPGKLGRLNSGRNPRRTAITAAALMVGVALVAGVGVILDSAKTSIGGLAEDAMDAELIISGEQTGPRPPSFDPDVLDRAAALPGVDTVAGLYGDQAEVDGQTGFVSAGTDLAAVRKMFGLTAESGTVDTLAPGQLVVDSRTAEDRGIAVGDRLPVQLSRGEPSTYQVVGVYEWLPIFGGFVLPPEATANFGIPQPDMGFVKLTEGTPADQVQPQVAALLADSPEVSVTDQNAFIEQQSSQLDSVLTMIQILLALAILIAVLGIINTLALSVLERTREIGLLRAVGLGRAATMRMITVEAVVIAVFGALLGVVVGSGLGAAVVGALGDEGITTLTLPWTQLATYLVLAGIVGVVAAVLPAIRAARTDVLTAIAYE
ncbi:MAG: FtsX-like permease family protein [Micromonosporaceae bacterium]|nr:FtsX-like permease family protein [Micromonosporaceae bacterium]